MGIFALFISILLFLYLILENYKKDSLARKHAESIFCNLAFAGIVFLAAFRGESVGADTGGYMLHYMEMPYYTFAGVLDRYHGYEFFYLVAKLFSLIEMPMWVWLGFIEFFYVTAIRRLIYNFSSDKLYSIMIFVSIGLFGFSLAGLKQTFAMALMLHAFLFFVDKKYLWSALLIVLTYYTHPACLIFGFGFLLYILRNKRYYYIIFVSIIIIIVFGAMATMSFLVGLLNQDHFDVYINEEGTYTTSTLFFYLLLLATAIPFCKQYIKEHEMAKVFLGFLIIACSLQTLAAYSNNLFRLAYLYTPFYLVFLPNVFDKHNTQMSRIIKIIALLGAIFFWLYAARNFHFTFIWQN